MVGYAFDKRMLLSSMLDLELKLESTIFNHCAFIHSGINLPHLNSIRSVKRTFAHTNENVRGR